MKWQLVIVDDEQSILDTLERLFIVQDNRFKVKTFLEPKLVLEYIKKHKADIVISDIKMPKMDGLTLLEEIKKINGQIQVIIMTGYTNLDNAIGCFEKGANDYILKPFEDLEQVREIVEYTVAKLNRWKSIIYASVK